MTIILACVAGLLALALLAAVIGASEPGRPIVYGGSLALCATILVLSVRMQAEASFVLPLGLPWLGAHFRLDALSRLLPRLVDLGGAGASLYAIGYGRHEAAPHRVLPFVPAFLAGMNLVVLAADAYTFLFAWELMSLASWALVVSHHRSADVDQGHSSIW